MYARRISAVPQPLVLARRLRAAGAPGLCLLWSRNHGGCSYVGAFPDQKSERVDPAQEGANRWGIWSSVPRFIGVVPYEACRSHERPAWSQPETRPPPWIGTPQWWRYPAVLVVRHDHQDVWVIADDAAAAQALVGPLYGTSGGDSTTDAPLHLELERSPLSLRTQHIATIESIVERIRDGEIYQLNYARRIDLNWRSGRTLDAFQCMARHAPSAFAAYLSLPNGTEVCATSPELLLHAKVDQSPAVGAVARFVSIEAEPIKGTAPRGSDADDDRERSDRLESDPKERAELAMIVDVVRNDANRVCVPGSVRVTSPPAVRACGSVFHRMASVVGRVRTDVSREAVLSSVLPSGSVTGAPKVRAMEVIAELETHRRGLYTGGYGYVARDGSMVLAMAIRCFVRRGLQGRYHTGGGIVLRSNPEREWAETEWKASQLFELLRPAGSSRAKS